MKIKPLTQLREVIASALSSVTNLSKSFQSFFIEAMELFVTIPNRMNFTQMARFGDSCESRFRQNFKKSFDWISFNRDFTLPMKNHRIAIAIDPSYISKSGKKTPGLGYFWSGCASAIKRGLEILGIALVDADDMTAVFLKAEQTFPNGVRGRRPKCISHIEKADSLIAWYLRMLFHNAEQLLNICNIIVADAYFSKETFVEGLQILGFELISRFRDDVSLKYLYEGPREKKRGRPKKFDGKVDLSNLDMARFKSETVYSDGRPVVLYYADVHAVSLKRTVKVVIVDYQDEDKKTQRRKVFFSTDLSLLPQDIFDLYRARFQEEFLFRDAKGFTGLTHCQARNKEALSFAFNMSLSAVNVARAYAREQGKVNMSVASTKTLLHNAAILNRFLSLSGITPNTRLNDTIFNDLLFYGVRDAV